MPYKVKPHTNHSWNVGPLNITRSIGGQTAKVEQYKNATSKTLVYSTSVPWQDWSESGIRELANRFMAEAVQ